MKKEYRRQENMGELGVYAFMILIDFPFSFGMHLALRWLNVPDFLRIASVCVLTVCVNLVISRLYCRGGMK